VGDPCGCGFAGVNDLGDPIEFVALLPDRPRARRAKKNSPMPAWLFRQEWRPRCSSTYVRFDRPASSAGLDWGIAGTAVFLKPVDSAQQNTGDVHSSRCCWDFRCDDAAAPLNRFLFQPQRQ